MKLTDEITAHIAQMPGHVESRKTPQLLIQARDKLKECEKLMKDILSEHADLCSNDYNECDEESCPWCKEAKEVLE